MGSFGFLRSSRGVDSGAPETDELPTASSIATCMAEFAKYISALFFKVVPTLHNANANFHVFWIHRGEVCIIRVVANETDTLEGGHGQIL